MLSFRHRFLVPHNWKQLCEDLLCDLPRGRDEADKPVVLQGLFLTLRGRWPGVGSGLCCLPLHIIRNQPHSL